MRADRLIELKLSNKNQPLEAGIEEYYRVRQEECRRWLEELRRRNQ
jgi:hypothetical protein